jgi:hypothetical protein
MGLCQSLVRGAGCQQTVAMRYLHDSRRKTLIFSGTITVFFRFIASAKMGGEAKVVQRGTIRGRIFYPVKGGMGRVDTTEGGWRGSDKI